MQLIQYMLRRATGPGPNEGAHSILPKGAISDAAAPLGRPDGAFFFYKKPAKHLIKCFAG